MVTLTSYFDESGKFADQRVVVFGGVVAVVHEPFFEDWEKHLLRNGLQTLTMKEALRHDRPLSESNPALGVDARVEALLPFIKCIRKHLLAISGVALDVEAFRSLPSHYHQILGNDPFFTAFLRSLMAIIEIARPGDKVMLICDDEEAMAKPMYKLYRRVKLVNDKARDALKCLCFGDDEFMFPLQAADCVSSIMRREADKRFFGTPYDYEPMFTEMTKQPTEDEKIGLCGIAFVDKAMLTNFAEKLKDVKGPISNE
jgi:hypothetical protein